MTILNPLSTNQNRRPTQLACFPSPTKRPPALPSPRPIRDLEELDLLCAKTHLGAIDGSKMTHKTLHEYIFMEEEGPDHTLELAGIDNAPGLYSEVTQCCRLIFSNKKRLVFTQVLHYAFVCFPCTEYVRVVATVRLSMGLVYTGYHEHKEA